MNNEEIAREIINKLFGLSKGQVPYRAAKTIEQALDAKDNQWISVEDDLPEPEETVLTCNMNCTNDYSFPYDPEQSLSLSFLSHSKNWIDEREGGETDTPTHFFHIPPLPKPPTNKQ